MGLFQDILNKFIDPVEGFYAGVGAVGDFFNWIFTGLQSIWFVWTIVVYLVLFFGIQLFFIYFYWKLFGFIVGLRPKFDMLVKRIEDIFK